MFYGFSFLLNLYCLNDYTEAGCHLGIVGIYSWLSNPLLFTISFFQRVLPTSFELIIGDKEFITKENLKSPFSKAYQKNSSFGGVFHFHWFLPGEGISFMRDKLIFESTFYGLESKTRIKPGETFFIQCLSKVIIPPPKTDLFWWCTEHEDMLICRLTLVCPKPKGERRSQDYIHCKCHVIAHGQ